jgi:hypothetical protein
MLFYQVWDLQVLKGRAANKRSPAGTMCEGLIGRGFEIQCQPTGGQAKFQIGKSKKADKVGRLLFTVKRKEIVFEKY